MHILTFISVTYIWLQELQIDQISASGISFCHFANPKIFLVLLEMDQMKDCLSSLGEMHKFKALNILRKAGALGQRHQLTFSQIRDFCIRFKRAYIYL